MTPAHVLNEWNACRSWLEPALQDDDEGDVINDLLLNRAQLWRGEKSAMITQLVASDEPYILVWKGGGELDDLLSLRPGVEAWARMHGAKAARINGRTGWARALKHVGFAPDGDDLRKVL